METGLAGAVQHGVNDAGSGRIDQVVPGVDRDLLPTPLGQWRGDVEAGEHDLFTTPDQGRWAAEAAAGGRPRQASRPRTAPHPVPYPQCTSVANRFAAVESDHPQSTQHRPSTQQYRTDPSATTSTSKSLLLDRSVCLLAGERSQRSPHVLITAQCASARARSATRRRQDPPPRRTFGGGSHELPRPLRPKGGIPSRPELSERSKCHLADSPGTSWRSNELVPETPSCTSDQEVRGVSLRSVRAQRCHGRSGR